MSAPRYEDHPGLDQSPTAERPWTAHRSSIPDEQEQIVVDEQWIVVDGPGARTAANGIPLRGQAYLYPSLKPLDEAPVDPPLVDRKYRHPRLVDANERWDGDPDGCSPWACRSGHATTSRSAAS